jgi:hypothetical protein
MDGILMGIAILLRETVLALNALSAPAFAE